MSIWTHVAGIIRFDGIFGLTPIPNCGEILDIEDNNTDKISIPCGSEGGLEYSIWINPCKNSLARYTVSIFGDLRDYSNALEIIKYFNKITENQLVRQGCFTIFEERQHPQIFIYDKSEFIKV